MCSAKAQKPSRPITAEAVTVPTGALTSVPARAIDPSHRLPQNPFRDPNVKPHWAELIRLAGDRATILFQELRRQLGEIEGLREDLHFEGPDRAGVPGSSSLSCSPTRASGTDPAYWGWSPRYRLGERTLFTAHLLPGRLEATVEIEPSFRETLLKSSRVAAPLKKVVQDASASDGAGRSCASLVRIGLSTKRAVRSFVRLVTMKSRAGQ